MTIPADFRGAALALQPGDVDRMGEMLGIEPRKIWAIASIETPGHGFIADGRPQLLYERHIFHRLTSGRWDASHPNISSSDSGNYGAAGAHQYSRLAEAMALDREAALKSATWGMFQILGANFSAVGYSDIDTFVAAMCHSEMEHLRAFAGFCMANNLVRFLRANPPNWESFATSYNGPAQAAGRYAERLAEAYAHGTFPRSAPIPPPPPPAPYPQTPAPIPPPTSPDIQAELNRIWDAFAQALQIIDDALRIIDELRSSPGCPIPAEELKTKTDDFLSALESRRP